MNNKKIKCLLFITLFLSSPYCFAQQIEIQISGTDGKAFLSELGGEKIKIIDSVIAIDAIYNYSFDNKHHTGIYRLSFSNNRWIDFIYDNEDVSIITNINNISDSLKVLESESNKIYYDFIKRNKEYKAETELLQLILARYPKEDGYYQITKEKLNKVQEDYLFFVNVTSQTNPNSFIARYVRSAQLPVLDSEIPFDEQLTYLKTHALDNVNFYDDGLIYSDAFTNKTIEYLTYFRNPQLPLGLLEKEFMSAVDTILNKAKVNSIVYQHIVGYLIDGFKKFGFDNVINYIVEDYVIKDDLCLDVKTEKSIQLLMNQTKRFPVGARVPDIILNDTSGNKIELNKINTDKTLIIFYASWCPHCQTLVPQVYDFYKSQTEKKFKVLAVSIDTSKTDWINFVKTNNLNWINVSDLKGWNGKAETDYSIYATPTMFLVDKQLKLIAKPSSIDELHNWF